MPPFSCRLALVLAILFGSTSPVWADSICGTIRNADTQAPVSGAAVFLFDALGDYTGQHTGSALDGTYCLTNVVPGTYTLQVRRDDYLIAVVSGVVVEEPVAVDIDAITRLLLAAPWPNPTAGEVNLRFRVALGTPLQLEVHDLAGRLVRAWRGRGTGADRVLRWNFLDHAGRRVASGTYLVTLHAGDQRLVRRISHLR